MLRHTAPAFDPVRGHEWQDDAACGETDRYLFFGSDKEQPTDRRKRETAAIAVCARCPVRAACLEYALDIPEKFGIWGGTTAEERARLRRLTPDARREAVGAGRSDRRRTG